MPSPRSTGGRRTPRGPHAPRVTAPDLPARFDGDADLAPRADLIGVRLRATGDVVSDAHGRIAESRLDEASVTRLDLTGRHLGEERLVRHVRQRVDDRDFGFTTPQALLELPGGVEAGVTTADDQDAGDGGLGA